VAIHVAHLHLHVTTMPAMFPMPVATVHPAHISIAHVHVRLHCHTAIAILTKDKAAETQQGQCCDSKHSLVHSFLLSLDRKSFMRSHDSRPKRLTHTRSGSP
jgi:murein endopeptidase